MVAPKIVLNEVLQVVLSGITVIVRVDAGVGVDLFMLFGKFYAVNAFDRACANIE